MNRSLRSDERDRLALVLAGRTQLANIRQDETLISEAQRRCLVIPIYRPFYPLANPHRFPHNHDPTGKRREAAIERYRAETLPRVEVEIDWPGLVGKLLVCYCYPKPCHGDILIGELKRRGLQE